MKRASTRPPRTPRLLRVRTAMALGLATTVLLAASCRQAPPQPRNVVLISLDTLRMDRMSLYGAQRRTTPLGYRE